jgi:hypothetical protein
MLGVALELDSQIAEPSQILQRRESSLTREPVQTPEQQAVETVRFGVLPHCVEPRAVVILCGHFVGVLSHNRPTLLLGELPQLQELVERVLAVSICADPSVNRQLHPLFHKRGLFSSC